MKENNELAKITVRVPAGCKKNALSFDALDSLTRDLARQTFVFSEGKQLLCRSFSVRTRPDGRKVMLLEVMEECFEVVENDR